MENNVNLGILSERNCNILFFGDSMFVQNQGLRPNLLSDLSQLTKKRHINIYRSMAGISSTHAKYYLPVDLKAKIDVAMVSIFVGDVNGYQLNKNSENPISLEKYIENISLDLDLIANFFAKTYNNTIFLYLYKTNGPENETQKILEAHQKILSHYNLASINVYQYMCEYFSQNNESCKKIFLSDEHHLTEKGAKFVSKFIVDELDEYIFDNEEISSFEKNISLDKNFDIQLNLVPVAQLLKGEKKDLISIKNLENLKNEKVIMIPGADRNEVTMIDIFSEDPICLTLEKGVIGLAAFCGVGIFSSKIEIFVYDKNCEEKALSKYIICMRDEHCYYCRSVLKVLFERKEKNISEDLELNLVIKFLEVDEIDLPKLKKNVVSSDTNLVKRKMFPVLNFYYLSLKNWKQN
eukprot:TRINITY_DN6461_c0_g1_i1.p1 TRINITY_DN6461_c0_g1~~TRINITY_DN6461_c0_g1_i1.p1  ORF type:complete len:416 (-),score=99.09 TRINITY_DN6461_c0_g1_i1:9-1232(-)